MCHQTVRLVAEAFELAGLATVVAGTMRTPLRGLPRVLITRYERGRNFGMPGDTEEHAELARAALGLFDAAEPTLLDHKAALRA